MVRILPVVVFVACSTGTPEPPEPRLTAVDRLTRASVLMVGTRPTLDQLESANVVGSFEQQVDAWLDDPRFGDAVRELHDEAWQVDTDFILLPANGPLDDVPMTRIRESINAAPLYMAQRVVGRDLPYTTLLTADWVVMDPVGVAAWSNVEGYDPSGPRWQPVQYSDDRPMAGILSYDVLWLRWRSAGTNHDRGRANAVSKALLCEDYLAREVSIDSSLDLTEPDALADAIQTDPGCVACHQTLDPLASAIPFNPYRVIQELEWPESMYHPAYLNNWLDTTGASPAFYGRPLVDWSDLGRALADDPRFARCTARRVAAYFTSRSLDDVPDEMLDGLQTHFVDSGYDFKALVKEVVLSDDFAQPKYHRVRPTELAIVIDDLTGFRWETELDRPCCGANSGSSRTGRVDLMADDFHGYNQLAGGFDAFYVEQPAHTFNPTTALVTEELARRAADHLVQADFDQPPSSRRLLIHVERGTVDRTAIDAQIRHLHARLFGELRWSASHQRTRELFERVAADSTPERAWRIVLMAMLSDVRLVVV